MSKTFIYAIAIILVWVAIVKGFSFSTKTEESKSSVHKGSDGRVYGGGGKTF